MEKPRQNVTEMPKSSLNMLDDLGRLITPILSTAKDVVEFFCRFVDELGNAIKRPLSLQELADAYSKSTDQIKQELSKKGLNFVGGKLNIGPFVEGSKKFKVGIEIYSQDSEGKWKKTEATQTMEIDSLNIDEHDGIRNDVVSFEII